jgi:TonB family protein
MTRSVYQLLFLVSFLALSCVVANGQAPLNAKTNFQPATSGNEESDRTRDGLRGPVRRVRTEVVKVLLVDGKLADNGKRVLLEMAEYDLKGAKTQNQYFPVGGSTATGRETYKYDDKGNISEMTLMAADGSLISKETYKYDYDSLGNWVKMTSSVAVVENGRISFEPTEVTHRTIFYYLDAAMTKMLETPAGTAVVPKPENAVTSFAAKNPDVKPTTGTSDAEKKSAWVLPPSIRAIKFTGASVPPLMPEFRNAQFGLASNTSVRETDAPPAPKPAAVPVLPTENRVLNGQALSLPAPVYPDAARRMQLVGSVRVEVVVDENGKVVEAKAVSGPTILRDNSVQAAFRARFTPTKLSGKPVRVSGSIVYNFTVPR